MELQALSPNEILSWTSFCTTEKLLQSHSFRTPVHYLNKYLVFSKAATE